MTRLALLTLALLATLAGAALAGGQSPGIAPALHAAGTRYLAVADGGGTTLTAAGRTTRLDGRWGFPRVTFNGGIEGVSHDRSTLVLARPVGPEGQLAAPTRFAILDAKTLELRKLVTIPGRLAYDAMSPDGRKLYLIEYVSVIGELRYRVRSYDVPLARLDRRVLRDKRSQWTTMVGTPFARATSRDGSWVYTLYGSEAKAFVHALNVREGYAVCVDLPSPLEREAGALRLRLAGSRLVVSGEDGGTRARIDTGRLRVLPSS